MQRKIQPLFSVLTTLLVVFAFNITGSGQPKASRDIKPGKTSDNGLAQTPPMGWNSWNHFHRDITEKLIMEEADAMVATGMKDAGYEYINLDDCWMALQRDKDGNLQADPKRFPHGMKYLADYIHKKGLKIGLYSSAGTKTCAGWPASLDHEVADAKMYAKWGIDYLKYDNCNNQGRPLKERYTAMKKALDAAGRPIVFSLCEWGLERPWEWAPELGNLWRTTGDISDTWESMLHIVDQQVGLYKFAGPGHWNDPDMLEVGNGGMTHTEYVSHFSLWCILAAPLIAGNDLRNMPENTFNILTNKEAIAIDQDPAGKQGYKLKDYGDREVWVKPLSGGDRAVLLFNRGGHSAFMTVKMSDIGIDDSKSYTIRDLWAHQDETVTDGLVRGDVRSHGVRMYRISVAH